jgi:hypothetical protein
MCLKQTVEHYQVHSGKVAKTSAAFVVGLLREDVSFCQVFSELVARFDALSDEEMLATCEQVRHIFIKSSIESWSHG